MQTISPKRLDALYAAFSGKRIAIVGDLMLDRYCWGRISRMSPEAPVPVVEIESEMSRLGGAANVANNVASLGGIPMIFGIVGLDEEGASFRKLVRNSGFSEEGIVDDPSRPTTCKTRVIAHNKHVLRIDRESQSEVDEDIAGRILESLDRRIRSCDAVILEDYNKGLLIKPLIQKIIELSRRRHALVAVDPKFNNFFEYSKVSVFKPNRKEAEEALGMKLNSAENVEAAGREILKRLDAENVLLTLGNQGMTLFQKSGEILNVPTRAKSVADVSGAGDTVISALTIALAGGATMQEAATLANYAAGIVCSEVGIVPIDPSALRKAVLEKTN